MISTITVIAASSIATGVAIFATIFLIVLLGGKQLLGSSSNNRKQLIGKCLSISIIPLLIGFTIIVGIKVAEILV